MNVPDKKFNKKEYDKHKYESEWAEEYWKRVKQEQTTTNYRELDHCENCVHVVDDSDYDFELFTCHLRVSGKLPAWMPLRVGPGWICDHYERKEEEWEVRE